MSWYGPRGSAGSAATPPSREGLIRDQGLETSVRSLETMLRGLGLDATSQVPGWPGLSELLEAGLLEADPVGQEPLGLVAVGAWRAPRSLRCSDAQDPLATGWLRCGTDAKMLQRPASW